MDIIKKVLDSLQGRKTYIIAVITAVLNLAVAFGWITPDNLVAINTVLVALGLGAIRAGISGK